MRAASLVLLGALVIAAPAAAQTFTQRGPTPPEQAAAARAEADRLIAAAQAQGLFVNESTGVLAQVRHLKSGLVCQFFPGDPKNAITIFASPGLPRGDDVSCGHNIREIAITTYATRYAPAKTAADVLKESLGAIRQQFTEVANYAGPSLSTKPDTKAGARIPSDFKILRLTAAFRGRPVFTRSAAAACEPWIVAQRVTVPADQALAADLAADLDFDSATASVCKTGAAGA